MAADLKTREEPPSRFQRPLCRKTHFCHRYYPKSLNWDSAAGSWIGCMADLRAWYEVMVLN